MRIRTYKISFAQSVPKSERSQLYGQLTRNKYDCYSIAPKANMNPLSSDYCSGQIKYLLVNIDSEYDLLRFKENVLENLPDGCSVAEI